MMIATNLLIKLLTCLTIFLMTSQTLAFMSWESKAKTHLDITRDAILQTTFNICNTQAVTRGKVVVLPDPLTVTSLVAACYPSNSSKDLQSSINEINNYNALVDVQYPYNASYHFNNEEFWAGHDLITKGVSTVINNVKQQSYQAARQALGSTLHTLQDFYSHSNWIELGKTQPFSTLTNPDTLITNIADSETCRSCNWGSCPSNILKTVIVHQTLTSGYFVTKPKGKCSHGGNDDPSSWGQGGINKDTPTSSHGYLHEQAASVATDASIALLDDIRGAIGDYEFLRLVGLNQTSALCFVIDTSSSMKDGIGLLRKATSSIIYSKNASLPLEYILVQFNNAGSSPITRTNDPNVFKNEINSLIPRGDGDGSYMSLTGLEKALNGSPPYSEIFVFTNAGIQDSWMTCTVRALIERTKSVVNFIIINPKFSTQIYQDLAMVSGGQVIDITKISQASNINALISNSTLVTLLQAVRNPPNTETFQFFVDFSVQNLIIFITGDSPNYEIISPTGESQIYTDLHNVTLWPVQTASNLYTVLPNEIELAGQWYIDFNSTQPYSVQVVGQSEIDFLFDFIKLSDGLHSSYSVLNTRPVANTNLTLLLSMVGADNVKPTNVALIKVSSSDYINGTLHSLHTLGSGQYLVSFNSTPAGNFTVGVNGTASFSANVNLPFQRYSPKTFQISNVNVTAQPFGAMEPGTQFTLPFTVVTNGSGGTFNIRVSNDQNFIFFTIFTTSTIVNSSEEFSNISAIIDQLCSTSFTTPTICKTITLESGVTVNGTVILTVPTNSSATEVMVTIQAEAADGSDFNYVNVRLHVDPPVKDFINITCEQGAVIRDCPADCTLSSWNLTATIHTGYGSGIPSVSVLQGNGEINNTTMRMNMDKLVTTIVYNSSCCFQDLELVAVDEVGNVATCYRSLTATAGPSFLTYGAECFFILLGCLSFNMEVSLY